MRRHHDLDRHDLTSDAVRPEITIVHLLKLVGAIALASEHEADGPSEADHLLAIAIDGVRPR